MLTELAKAGKYRTDQGVIAHINNSKRIPYVLGCQKAKCFEVFLKYAF